MKESCSRGHRTIWGTRGKRGWGVLMGLIFCISLLLGVDGAVLSEVQAWNDCTNDQYKICPCGVGFACCLIPDENHHYACFSNAPTCAGPCLGTNCTDKNVCVLAPLTPKMSPAACTASDTKCTNALPGKWCCKLDGAVFDPTHDLLCAGQCSSIQGNCTVDNVCEKRRTTPRSCTAEDAAGACMKCKEGQKCCARDGKCIEDSNTTCANTLCSGTNCNTGMSNLCVRPKEGEIPPCTNYDGKCTECPKETYCCKETNSCIKSPSGDPVCSGTNWNATQVCYKKTPECPKWTHTFTFVNKSTEKIWLAAIPGCWNEGKSCHPVPSPGGWELAANTGTATVSLPSCWSGGFIVRTGCTFNTDNGKHCSQAPCCATGDCVDGNGKPAFSCVSGGKSPASRIEMTLDGGMNSEGVKLDSLIDYYDVSFVNGWTKMLTMKPTGTNWSPTPPPNTDFKAEYWCTTSGCNGAPQCPDPLSFKRTDTTTKKTYTYCWAPVSFVGDLHKNDGTITVEYPKGTRTPYTNDNALKSRLGCVCNSASDIKCETSPGKVNPLCVDNTGAKDFYGCSPFVTPPFPRYSTCCPWSSNDPEGKKAGECKWNEGVATEKKRIWPDWAKDYVRDIKATCPKAYSWQFDDAKSTYSCISKYGDSAVNYEVVIYDGPTALSADALQENK